MAPLDDLIHSFLIAFKDSLDTAIASVFHPTFYPKFKGRLLSMVAEKDSLDPSFNNHPCPYFFHINYVMDVAPPFIGGRSKTIPSAINADATPISVTSAENGLTLKIITDFSLNQR